MRLRDRLYRPIGLVLLLTIGCFGAPPPNQEPAAPAERPEETILGEPTSTVLLDIGESWRQLKGIMMHGSARVLESAQEEDADPGLLEARARIEQAASSRVQREEQVAVLLDEIQKNMASLAKLRAKLHNDLASIQNQAQEELETNWRR